MNGFTIAFVQVDLGRAAGTHGKTRLSVMTAGDRACPVRREAQAQGAGLSKAER
jgi:hypothetical protein